MRRHLVRVRVVTAVLCVEDARPEVRRVNAGNVAKALGDRVVCVLNRGLVLLRSGLYDVGACEDVLACAGTDNP